MQVEVYRFWSDHAAEINMDPDKIKLSEDPRLMIASYVLSQVASEKLVAQIYALQDFVNEQLYEECAPIATFEAAIKVIQLEYEDKLKQ